MYARRLKCGHRRWGSVFQPSKDFTRPNCVDRASSQSLSRAPIARSRSSHNSTIRRHFLDSITSRGVLDGSSYSGLHGRLSTSLKSSQLRVYSSKGDGRNTSEEEHIPVKDGSNIDKGKTRREKVREDVNCFDAHARLGEQDQREWLSNEKLAIENKKKESPFFRIMASLKLKPHSRYSSYDTRSSTSSHFSDPSSSTEQLTKQLKLNSSSSSSSSKALVVKSSRPSDLSSHTKSKPSNPNLATMVKKFMEKKPSSSSSKAVKMVIPSDVIAEDLKKTARKGTSFKGLHKKLFGAGNETTALESKKKKEVKALTEVKENTRTLAMVLRSERELLGMNKEQEMEISQLKFMLEEKSTEVEKLKDLCLKQREEIKALKSAILFPDVLNSQLQGLLEKQNSELKQAKQLIPTLQRQVTSLTGQLQYLAEDLAEVKADKHSARACFQHHGSSPRTPIYDLEQASNSLDFSSGDPTTPGSPDDMFLKDVNPCLTPYCAKSKSKEFEATGYDSPDDEFLFENNMEIGFNSRVRKMSKSSDCCQNANTGSTMARAARRSDETKCTYGKQMHHKLF